MSIDLDKRVEKVGIILEKRNILKAPVVRVGVILDVSGSTQDMFTKGIIQETVARLLALGITFDDNGQMDMWTFDDDFTRLPQSNRENYENFVVNEIMDNDEISKWGGTSYAPVMDDAVNFYFRGTEQMVEVQVATAAAAEKPGFLSRLFGSKPAAPTVRLEKQFVPAEDTDIPALVLFVTDGRADDSERAAKILRAAQAYKIYWSMVGVGDAHHFQFLEQMADELPNVGFVNFSSLNISDDALYDAVITDEFCTWVKQH